MIVATFQDKMGRDWLRKREKKIIVPISSYRPRNREFQKNSKKIQKIKKHHYGFFSSQNEMGLVKKERKKNIVPISSYLTRNRKFQKNSKKFKKLKNIIMASFQARIGWERLRNKEKKLSFRSVPT